MSREMNNDINNWIAVMYVAHMTPSPLKEYIFNYARYIKSFFKAPYLWNLIQWPNANSVWLTTDSC